MRKAKYPYRRESHAGNAMRALAVLFAAALGIFCADCSVWLNNYAADDKLFYAGTTLPMFISADGFFYMAEAQRWLAGAGNAPLLSVVAGMAARVTGCPLESACFWLPVAGAFWLAPVFLIWRRAFAWPWWCAAAAAFLFYLIPAWVCRSHAGWFDTDFGIALFSNYCLAGLVLLARRDRALSPAGIALMLAGGILLALWWKPGVFLLPVALVLWGVVLFREYAREAILRRILLGAAASLIALTALALAFDVAGLRRYAAAHLALVFQSKDIVAGSIRELRALPAMESLTLLGGNAAAGAAAVLALLVLCVRRARFLPVLLPYAGVLVLGFVSQRFLYLAALPVALALADLLHIIGGEEKIVARRAAALCAGLCFVCAMGWWLYAWQPKVYFTRNHDAAAQSLRSAASKDARIWNWWDDGYFLRARTGLAPLFDGGSQTSGERAYWAARSFVGGDARFSRRWMRFFSLRGEAGLEAVARAWGGKKAAYAALETIFQADDPAKVAAEKPALPGGTMEWLFPEGQVFLYLPQRLLGISHVWEPLGRLGAASSAEAKACIDVFLRGNFFYDSKTGKMGIPQEVFDRGYKGVTDFLLTDEKALAAPWPDKGLYLVANRESPFIYIVTPRGLSSLPLRLMAPGGAPLEGYRPVGGDYGSAGVWELLPEKAQAKEPARDWRHARMPFFN